MFNRVRIWLASDKSWPFLLGLVTGAYVSAPRELWATVTFLIIGTLYLFLVAAHTLEFWQVQRKWPYLLFAIAKFFFGVALLIGALVAVPQHRYDFTELRMVSRVLWLIGLPFWAVAVYHECWRVYRAWKEQGET